MKRSLLVLADSHLLQYTGLPADGKIYSLDM
jgi:hypothetical protein